MVLTITLYPLSIGVNLASRKNIEGITKNVLGIIQMENWGNNANFQALCYEFDNDEFHAIVHGRLRCEKLRQYPVLTLCYPCHSGKQFSRMLIRRMHDKF
ncbi:hypothetical protein GQ457_06G030660 [Hibiscus cannabinus]